MSAVSGAVPLWDRRSTTAKHRACRSLSSCWGSAKIRRDSTSTLGWRTRWSGSPTRWCATGIPSSVGDQLSVTDFGHVHLSWEIVPANDVCLVSSRLRSFRSHSGTSSSPPIHVISLKSILTVPLFGSLVVVLFYLPIIFIPFIFILLQLKYVRYIIAFICCDHRS